MKYYKDSSGNVFAFALDGSQDNLIGDHLHLMTEAEVENHFNAEPSVLQKILALESQQTPRRIREAALGLDAGWLANLDSQIAALRAQLAD